MVRLAALQQLLLIARAARTAKRSEKKNELVFFY
jgi:hypothetical protein